MLDLSDMSVLSGLCSSQVSAWGGYVFIINLIPLHVFVLLLMQRYSRRVYIGETHTQAQPEHLQCSASRWGVLWIFCYLYAWVCPGGPCGKKQTTCVCPRLVWLYLHDTKSQILAHSIIKKFFFPYGYTLENTVENSIVPLQPGQKGHCESRH